MHSIREVTLLAAAATWLACAFTTQQRMPESGQLLTKGKRVVQPLPSHPADDLVKRGEYLVMVMGCADCHAPKKLTPNGPVPDMDRFLSGYNSAIPLGTYDKNIVKTGQWVLFNGQNTAFVGPWGVSFAANLTPDETGIGTWTLEQFTKAMRQGKFKGLDNTRPLLPPMPWPNYTNMTDTDLRAVFTYLKSIKPITNVVPATIPPAP